MRRSIIQPSLSAVLLLWLAARAVAQAAPDPSGHWEGLITWAGNSKTPAGETSVQVDLVRSAKNGLIGQVSVPGHKLVDRALVNIAEKARSIVFQIALSPTGDNTFKGVLSADGKTMSGDLIYQGTPLPFTLTRTGDSRMILPPESTPVASELEGTWNGTMTAGEKSLRLVLRLNNQAEGPARGVIVTLDQGNLEIPITTITQEAANLTLDLKAAGGAYSGRVNADNTEIAGTWTQGTLALPLLFKRAPR